MFHLDYVLHFCIKFYLFSAIYVKYVVLLCALCKIMNA